ncbi:MAG: hypothetical protein WCT28_04420 [Patescibacteria group bacterium]|jgi:hypothetical protein
MSHTTLIAFGACIGAIVMFPLVFYIQRWRFNLREAAFLKVTSDAFSFIAQGTDEQGTMRQAMRGLTDSVGVLRGKHRISCVWSIVSLAIGPNADCRRLALDVLMERISKEDLFSVIDLHTSGGRFPFKFIRQSVGVKGEESAEKLLAFYFNLRTMEHLDASINERERKVLEEKLNPPASPSNPAEVLPLVLAHSSDSKEAAAAALRNPEESGR